MLEIFGLFWIGEKGRKQDSRVSNHINTQVNKQTDSATHAGSFQRALWIPEVKLPFFKWSKDGQMWREMAAWEGWREKLHYWSIPEEEQKWFGEKKNATLFT